MFYFFFFLSNLYKSFLLFKPLKKEGFYFFNINKLKKKKINKIYILYHKFIFFFLFTINLNIKKKF
jgi:hypothetical protein